MLKAMPRSFLFVACATVAALALAACGGSSEYDDMTPKELLDRVEEALTREGEVLHLRSRPEGVVPRTTTYEHEAWLALDASEARFTSRLFNQQRGIPREPAFTITNGNEVWVTVGDGLSPSFPLDTRPCLAVGANPLIEFFACLSIFVLGQEDQRHVLETGLKYDGRNAVAVLTIFSVPDAATGITNRPERRLFIDAETLMPLAIVETLEREAPVESLREVVGFETEFIPRDSLPAGFFDPASIGWVETE